MRTPLRHRRERRVQAASDLTITSMVDMFTMILTFLLNFVDPSMGEEGLLALPTARATAPAAEGVVVQVSLGEVRVGGATVVSFPREGVIADADHGGGLIPALVEVLGAQGAQDAVPLVLECDRRVPFAVVGEVLQSARRAGFSHYRFVVNREAQ